MLGQGWYVVGSEGMQGRKAGILVGEWREVPGSVSLCGGWHLDGARVISPLWPLKTSTDRFSDQYDAEKPSTGVNSFLSIASRLERTSLVQQIFHVQGYGMKKKYATGSLPYYDCALN
jgi:hypothetical protein